MSYPESVILTEVGPRDGLQTVSAAISAERKIEIISGLVEAGLKQIQVTSFVHPKWVPQMADAEQVCATLPQTYDVIYSGLVLNAKGVERSAAAGLKRVEASISTSDTHSRKNANMGLDEAVEHLGTMVRLAQEGGMEARGGLQSVWGCVYDGIPPDERIVDMAQAVIDMGVVALSLADSTGMGDPVAVKRLLEKVLPMCGGVPVVLHLHDTRGLGLANVIAAMEMGVNQFDTAFGGLGGCPFIEGATGNIATEDTVNMLGQMGVDSGVTVEKVAAVSKALEETIGSDYFSGKLYKLVN